MIAEIVRRRVSLTVGTIALTGLSGCSLAFVEGPPANHASRHFFDCTSSMLAPGLDAAFGATMALGTLGATSDGSHDSSTIVTSSALVVGALASATYGYLQVSHCRQAKEALAARLIDAPYLGAQPPAAPSGTHGAPGPDASDRTHAPAPRDPWLSEGPPPPPYMGLPPQGPPPTALPPTETAAPAPPPASGAPPAAPPTAPAEPSAPAETESPQ